MEALSSIIYTMFTLKCLIVFRRIYPEQNEKEYEQYFVNSCSLFQETASSKARIECARLQREEIKMKSEYIENRRRKNGIGGGKFHDVSFIFLIIC